jgi:hypothetical protein
VALNLRIALYQLFSGRSYIKTSAYIAPNTVINVRNDDNCCFVRAILSAMYPAGFDNPHRPVKYRAYLGLEELNFTGIKFPVKVTDIAKFERSNPDLSVSVFG